MKAAKLIGIALYAAVTLWDCDAMLPHIAAHSWITLGYVSLFLVGHLVDGVSLGSISFSSAIYAIHDAVPQPAPERSALTCLSLHPATA